MPIEVKHAERAGGEVGVEVGGRCGGAEANSHLSAVWLAGCVLFTSVICCMEGDLRVKAEECGLAHPTGDALRPLLDMVERSVGRDASWDYRVPVAGIRVGPIVFL